MGWSNGIGLSVLRRSGGSRSVGKRDGRPAAPLVADRSLPDQLQGRFSQRLRQRTLRNGRSGEAKRKFLSRNARKLRGLVPRPFATSAAVAPICEFWGLAHFLVSYKVVKKEEMVKQRRHRRAPLETLAVWPHSTARRGLAEEFVPFLFERLARRTNSNERRQGLARLGLAIARATRRPTARRVRKLGRS